MVEKEIRFARAKVSEELLIADGLVKKVPGGAIFARSKDKDNSPDTDTNLPKRPPLENSMRSRNLDEW